jgi:hypothetical protein
MPRMTLIVWKNDGTRYRLFAEEAFGVTVAEFSLFGY